MDCDFVIILGEPGGKTRQSADSAGWMLDEWREGAAMVDWASLRPGHVAGGGAAGSVARARAKVRASLD